MLETELSMTDETFWQTARRNRNFVMGLAITLLIVAMATISFIWTPYDVTILDIAGKLKGPSATHWFGTDHFGRDIFSMIMVGARNSIAVALVAVSDRCRCRRSAGLLGSSARRAHG